MHPLNVQEKVEMEVIKLMDPSFNKVNKKIW